jgi:hypothetical protein
MHEKTLHDVGKDGISQLESTQEVVLFTDDPPQTQEES